MEPDDRIEQWFLRYGNDVYQYLAYFTGRRDVEDLVQEVFTKALKALSGYEGRAQPRTWLLSIARHAAIDHSRKQKMIDWFPETVLGFLRSKERSPENALVLKEQLQEVYHTMNQLKRTYREVLILRLIEGISTEETAEILGWSEAKVSTTLHRAVKALQKRMSNSGKEVHLHDAIF
ncbi:MULTISPECIES: RNA polymerase sigma factor [Brevibacillus]|jgi:RNA polymerase sigma-70 factor (ECF subfamily)|uniref:ECF RNA polymerase sigma factor SigX n=1 Tax=Brevibacillus parabrevis TaxID=54914 RepID=A0A4Y3PMJ5_BREPA|nr:MULTISPECIES: RNA polymerase sigma factor [Brevibacillus]MBU8714188.1 RNA polymerase sigma factor [Brevibacillus parabrevis]MDH6350358.1 RNA polymerase sigma-70 factor (ECF subfamily) [Brevibacillus sp. 1238]MDR5001828.1 RNA polymerase sigma factor [Brevibacillus parabrevis]MED2253430.1 RNA polymerase sigma factor [Brevibacillus parabrevis]NRQ55775.1 RNA polymerase sigma factor [Brevibacillus sp. HD1.4A]